LTELRLREAPPCRSLGEYVAELVGRLDGAEPAAVERMREVVGARRARIRLDGEVVDVAFGADGSLRVGDPSGRVDGEGAVDRQTVLDLLDGYVEVTDAILDGRLAVAGETDAIARMFVALELLLDGSTRIPALQELARDFRNDPCRDPVRPRSGHVRRGPWHSTGGHPAERSLLERNDLLP
jgi:hypothetical protein